MRAAHWLAWHLGCTVEELSERMSGQEFGDWLVFMQVEGIGPGAGLDRWAQLMAVTANGALRKADHSMFSKAEFLPNRWTPRAVPAPATGASARAFVQRLREQQTP